MKKLINVVLIMLMLLCFVACDNSVSSSEDQKNTGKSCMMLYMDMCDLDALENLDEICKVTPTSNTKIFILTGARQSKIVKDGKNVDISVDPYVKANDGSYKFPNLANALKKGNNCEMSFGFSHVPHTYQVWELTSNGLENLEAYYCTYEDDTMPLSSKGINKQSCLTDFINYCYKKTNDANCKYMLQLWNHGGGSYEGCLSDSLTDKKTMMVYTIADALKESAIVKAGKKLDAVIFDMCLMQGIEVAYSLKDFTKYIVASQVLSIASDYYSQYSWLCNNPGGDTLEFCKLYANSGLELYSKEQTADGIDRTWSVVDTSKLDALFTAYEAAMKQLYDKLDNDESEIPEDESEDGFGFPEGAWKDFTDIALSSQKEKNKDDEDFTCYFRLGDGKDQNPYDFGAYGNGMVDLAYLTNKLAEKGLIDKTAKENLLSAIKKAVVYNRTGIRVESFSNGLSTYIGNSAADKASDKDHYEDYHKYCVPGGQGENYGSFSYISDMMVKKLAGHTASDIKPTTAED